MSDNDFGFRDPPAGDDSRWRADEEQAHADHLHEDAVELYRERTGFGDPRPAKRLTRAQTRDTEKAGLWRNEIFDRDQGCVSCDVPETCEAPFEAHHVVPAQRLRRERPDLMYEPRAGMTLCSKAHRRFHAGTHPIFYEQLPRGVVEYLAASGYRHYLADHYPRRAA